MILIKYHLQTIYNYKYIAYFSHCNNYNLSNYAIKQTHQGSTYINAKYNEQVYFTENNNTYMTFNDVQNNSTLTIQPNNNDVALRIKTTNQNNAILSIVSTQYVPIISWEKLESTFSMGINQKGNLSIHDNSNLSSIIPIIEIEKYGVTTFKNNVSSQSNIAVFLIKDEYNNIHFATTNKQYVSISHSNPLTNLDVLGKILVDKRSSYGPPQQGIVGGDTEKIIWKLATNSNQYTISTGVEENNTLWNNVPNGGSFKWYYDGINNTTTFNSNNASFFVQTRHNVYNHGELPSSNINNVGAKILLRDYKSNKYPIAIGQCDLSNQLWLGVPIDGFFKWYANNNEIMSLNETNGLKLTHCNQKGSIECGQVSTYGPILTNDNYINTESGYIKAGQIIFKRKQFNTPQKSNLDNFVGGTGTKIVFDSIDAVYQNIYKTSIGHENTALWFSIPAKNNNDDLMS